MRNKFAVILMAMTGSLSPITPATAAEDIQTAVKTCIDTVHSQGYPYFDAFYNAADKTVQNNVLNALQQPALFPFNKCMASQGFPLSYQKK